MYGKSLAERFTTDKYQLMHIEMFNHHIIHAECIGGDIDLLVNRRATIGFFPWRFVDGESCIGRMRGLCGRRRVRGADGPQGRAAPDALWRLLRPRARGADQPADQAVIRKT